ncbi:YiiD C-terminal domain-containing protein [Pokkaliibacter sp. CJK22405]|uniref:YiiD C-terminal domain-containing protein n=1 Tax=Pokkaliibacter sp. CJK22405 TaxID=3384615 RepID=UPI00398497DA
MMGLEKALRQVQQRLDSIPLTAAMQLEPLVLSERDLSLCAPIEPNVNDKGTGFGGALASVATLAGWALVSVLAERVEPGAFEVVVHKSNLEYQKPVRSSFTAKVGLPEESELDSFEQKLKERGKAALNLMVHLIADDGIAMLLTGRFVAYRSQ